MFSALEKISCEVVLTVPTKSCRPFRICTETKASVPVKTHRSIEKYSGDNRRFGHIFIVTIYDHHRHDHSCFTCITASKMCSCVNPDSVIFTDFSVYHFSAMLTRRWPWCKCQTAGDSETIPKMCDAKQR